jgi:hypothetical protein
MNKSSQRRVKCSRPPKVGRERRIRRTLYEPIPDRRVLAMARHGTAGSVSIPRPRQLSTNSGARLGLIILRMRKSMFVPPRGVLTTTVWVRYIDVVKKATLIKKISATQEIWSSYYEFPTFGVSPRVFTVLQVTHYEPSSPRTGCVNSVKAAPFSPTHSLTVYSYPSP